MLVQGLKQIFFSGLYQFLYQSILVKISDKSRSKFNFVENLMLTILSYMTESFSWYYTTKYTSWYNTKKTLPFVLYTFWM